MLVGREARVLVADLVPVNPLKTDHVGHQVIALPILREMPAGEDLGARAGAGALGEEWLHAAMLVGIVEVARERRGVIIDVARAVGHEVLAPAVKRMTMWVGEADT